MFKLANYTSTYRSKLIAKAYEGWLKKNYRVLDIGCGTGVIADELAKKLKFKVTGCDIDKYLARNIPFKKMRSLSRIPFKYNSFDVAMFNDVLHHTNYENQPVLLKEAFRVAREVFIFELKPTFIGKAADLLINKIHNPNMEIPYTYRSVQKWKKLFKRMGLKVEIENVRKPSLYPFTHVAFRVAKLK